MVARDYAEIDVGVVEFNGSGTVLVAGVKHIVGDQLQ